MTEISIGRLGRDDLAGAVPDNPEKGIGSENQRGKAGVPQAGSGSR